MRTLSPKVLRELREFVRDLGRDDLNASARLIDAIDAALTPKRAAKPARELRKAKVLTRKEKTASVREAVMGRAGGCCEGCGAVGRDLQLDHFRGGASKRSNESVEGCWMLCAPCHHEKTDNKPSRMHWLATFLGHCHKHGYLREERETGRTIDALSLAADSRGWAG